MVEQKVYRKDLDAVKGIAIIAVVLFHMGLLKSGYLGVDAFFVINGFLIIPSIFKHLSNNDFSYFDFLEKRIVRLLPLVVLASIVCLLVGYIGMLPDNYENLTESIIASNLFSENILSAVTTKDYWNVSNDYKPLMHMWYVGILFEFYLLFPLFMMIGKWLSKKLSWDFSKCFNNILGILFAISLILYLLPIDSESNKFYFVQYRFFEICLGGIIGMNIHKLVNRESDASHEAKLQYIPIVLFVGVLFSSLYLFSKDTIGTQMVPIGGGLHY